MHRKYGKDGVVTMSVALDDPKDQKAQARVKQFLAEQKATFQNFVLDEHYEVWEEKLDIAGPPLQVVFGRDGVAAGRFVGDFEEVEKLVKKLLNKKE